MAGVKLGGDVALDLGCGIGRMTHALTGIYRKAIGVDISDEIVRVARQHANAAPVEYLQVIEPPPPFADRSIELSFSTIVAQHIPVPHNLHAVEELFRISRKAVVFDAPSHKMSPSDSKPTGGIAAGRRMDAYRGRHSGRDSIWPATPRLSDVDRPYERQDRDAAWNIHGTIA
jgi:ubiquinone/menaquinone biosynthesis C-methylase UbiE